MPLTENILLNGNTLTADQVVAVAFKHYTVEITPEALSNVERTQRYIAHQVELGQIIYGVTTGFGLNADKIISKKDASELQRNLLLSHACGVGESLDIPIVRALMLIRLNTLLAGHSGVRVQTIRLLQSFLNLAIHPDIPEQGSVGASGDLCPLSHMALPLIGEGFVWFQGEKMATAELYQHPAIQQINQKITQQNARLPKEEQHPLIAPITLTYKEGIGLNNGTTLMVALGIISTYKANQLLEKASLSIALVLEALCAKRSAYDTRIHTVRRHVEQQEINQKINALLTDSTYFGINPENILASLPPEFIDEAVDVTPIIAALKEQETILTERFDHFEPYAVQLIAEERLLDLKTLLNFDHIEDFLRPKYCKITLSFIPYLFCDLLSKYLTQAGIDNGWDVLIGLAKKKVVPQDAYSIRCVPQVLGASLQAIRHAAFVFNNELNAVVDNPIIFRKGQVLPDGFMVTSEDILSGGNFHGQPLALALDYLKLAIAEIGSLLERQINKLLDGNTNDRLPSFLISKSGLHSGLMMPQYTAAALVSENKVLVHPASADSIPTSANQEDHVSMGPIAGRQALEILRNVQKIHAIHSLTAFQAFRLRQHQFEGKVQVQQSKATADFCQFLQEGGIDFLENDRFLHLDILKIMDLLYDK